MIHILSLKALCLFLQVAFIANEERINDFIVMKEQRKKDAFELVKYFKDVCIVALNF
jgi:hypothetical protein